MHTDERGEQHTLGVVIYRDRAEAERRIAERREMAGYHRWPDRYDLAELVPADPPASMAPEHRAARQRTDDERAALAERACCGDAAEGPDEDGVLLHTLGCPNRCAVDVPCLAANGGPGTYPCAASVGHDGEHWVLPEAQLPRPAIKAARDA